MKRSLFLLLLVSCAIFPYSGSSQVAPASDPPKTVIPGRPGSLGIIGDITDVQTTVQGGIVLMGGSTDVDAAFKWMIERSGGGDVVIIRASGTSAYNPYVFGLGKVNSVETLKIDSRELADNDTVANIIRNAEMLFIAGGDQSNYMKYWMNTKTGAAINYLLNEKQAPVGGTSAGCAILGGLYYSGETGSAVSDEVLQNPYATSVTVHNNDFLQPPGLSQVITDQHFLARKREGRTMVFLGRILKDWNIAAKAIAVDERTAVCIDKNGIAKVFADNNPKRPYSFAYFVMTDHTKQPEQWAAGKPVQWSNNEQAASVYEIQSNEQGGGYFDVQSFDGKKASGGKWYWWWIDNGALHKKEQSR
jgi:cyanophycinase-like exopeptidase